jgi:hypothetical protein
MHHLKKKALREMQISGGYVFSKVNREDVWLVRWQRATAHILLALKGYIGLEKQIDVFCRIDQEIM